MRDTKFKASELRQLWAKMENKPMFRAFVSMVIVAIMVPFASNLDSFATTRARGPAATTNCAPAQLGLHAMSATAAATHDGFLLRFTNTRETKCWLRGYSTVEVYGGLRPQRASDQPSFYLGGLLSFSGATIPVSSQPRAVLEPGRSAYEWVGDDDSPLGGKGTCPSAKAAVVRIVSQSAKGTTYLDLNIPVPGIQLCWSAPLVTPIVPFITQHSEGMVFHTIGTYYLP